ncbi:MAG: tetratricopeptide repeat protein [Acidimicrobiales bacterium]
MSSNPRPSNSRPSSGGGRRRRVPPPPVLRDPVEIARIDDEAPAKAGKKRRRGGSTIDVSEVVFPGVASDTTSKLRRRLIEAATAFEAERFADAQRLLVSINKLAPGVPEVQELLGLSLYRQGRWSQAAKELQSFADMTNSVEQHPVLADRHRALRHWDTVEALWLELGAASPAAELVEEGRIVYAGALADNGKPKDAIRILETAPKAPSKPKEHHLRRWYALADLYERNGEASRARKLFLEIDKLSPNFGDAAQRARQLR